MYAWSPATFHHITTLKSSAFRSRIEGYLNQQIFTFILVDGKKTCLFRFQNPDFHIMYEFANFNKLKFSNYDEVFFSWKVKLLHIKRLHIYHPLAQTFISNVCLFVCFGPPTTQATRHPRAGSLVMFLPPPPVLLSCILHQVRTLPILLSCTHILPSIWSVPFLSSRHAHIFKPHKYEPLKPQYKLCYFSLLLPTTLQVNSSITLNISIHVSSMFQRPSPTKVARFLVKTDNYTQSLVITTGPYL